jgi:hypothetical protein
VIFLEPTCDPLQVVQGRVSERALDEDDPERERAIGAWTRLVDEEIDAIAKAVISGDSGRPD